MPVLAKAASPQSPLPRLHPGLQVWVVVLGEGHIHILDVIWDGRTVCAGVISCIVAPAEFNVFLLLSPLASQYCYDVIHRCRTDVHSYSVSKSAQLIQGKINHCHVSWFGTHLCSVPLLSMHCYDLSRVVIHIGTVHHWDTSFVLPEIYYCFHPKHRSPYPVPSQNA